MTKKEKYEQIIELQKLHPDLDIMLFVDSDELCDYGGYTLHEIDRVEVAMVLEVFEHFILVEEEIRDYLADEKDKDSREVTDAEIQEAAHAAIVVYTTARRMKS
jgi:hypothetical protein